MEASKTMENDPIKDKYTKKVGIFKKIQIKFNNFKEKIKNNKSIMDDIGTLIGMLTSVAIYGTMGAFSLGLFGFEFSISIVFGIGSALWLLENKFIDFTTRILGSIKIVQINN